MRNLTDKPAGFLCLGKQFCWPVYGWSPNRLQRFIWRHVLGVSWVPHE